MQSNHIQKHAFTGLKYFFYGCSLQAPTIMMDIFSARYYITCPVDSDYLHPNEVTISRYITQVCCSQKLIQENGWTWPNSLFYFRQGVYKDLNNCYVCYRTHKYLQPCIHFYSPNQVITLILAKLYLLWLWPALHYKDIFANQAAFHILGTPELLLQILPNSSESLAKLPPKGCINR
jgi:hypothetical protein